MAHIRSETYRAIEENDLDHIVFQDPFSEVTRKAKRNLLVASFIAVLIAVLKLEVTGFLGLQASNLKFGNDIAQGLSFIVVAYFLVSFLFHAYIDYSAWNFKRERQATKPYLDLISMLESHIDVTCEQVNNAVNPLNHVSFERDMQAEMELDSRISGALDQLKQINRRIEEIAEETRPLFHAWSRSTESMNRLSWRLRARIWSLWLLDIAVPICFSVLALSLVYKGLPPLAFRALS